jgi:uncharacterized protein YndB with AHSA1/START domain
VSSTCISRRVNAPRAIVYRALLDARAVATWMVPARMSSHVHAFDPRESGSFRISLTYDAPTGTAGHNSTNFLRSTAGFLTIQTHRATSP